jgi:pyruvate kinase
MLADDPKALLAEVRHVRDAVEHGGAELLEHWRPLVHRAAFRRSAENLAHYLVLRRLDLRPIQAALAPWGLTTLGRCESRVMPSLSAITANLELIGGTNKAPARPQPDDFNVGAEALEHQTAEVLGPPPQGRLTRILVTMAARAASDYDHVASLIRCGMDCARVNCAHDAADTWTAMIGNIRRAAGAAGRECRVLMDLAGPKIRTRQVLTPPDRKTVVAGDRILLTFEKPAPREDFAFQTACSMPEILRQVALGAGVSIKDGLIQGRIEDVRQEGIVMLVDRTPPEGQPLQKEKGINFPGSALNLSPLTRDDLRNLDFVAEHADIVSYSFVQRPEDIARLQNELEKRRPGRPPMPIVAKIETQLAFSNLPEMIVQAAGSNPFAVMIARGDLAVEIGFERLSEAQEEILWLCEAAHVPVIWATQVLESLVKRGMPSRGEFTDAAMAQRAECVMLNKGPYIDEGITVLDHVLKRMESHKQKRSTQLRPLKAWADVH